MVRQTVKSMLIDLYKEEREQERCTLVHGLKKDAKGFAKPYMDSVMVLRKEIAILDSQMHKLRIEIHEQEEERDKALREAKLYSFTIKTCGDALHKKLCDFDKMTNDHIRSILEEGKKG